MGISLLRASLCSNNYYKSRYAETSYRVKGRCHNKKLLLLAENDHKLRLLDMFGVYI